MKNNTKKAKILLRFPFYFVDLHYNWELLFFEKGERELNWFKKETAENIKFRKEWGGKEQLIMRWMKKLNKVVDVREKRNIMCECVINSDITKE